MVAGHKKQKIDFPDGRHLGFPIRTILAIFDLQELIPMLPPKFHVNWPFGSGERKRKIDFQDGHHGGHLGLQIGMILAIFLSTNHLDASYQVPRQLAFQFRRRSDKQIFKMPTISWISDWNNFSYF